MGMCACNIQLKSHALIPSRFAGYLVMAAAYYFYDMRELDAEDVHLPTAQFHYDVLDVDLEDAAACAYTGDLWTADAYMGPPPFDEPPSAPDVLCDGSLWFYIYADLLQIATSLVAFFGQPSALIASVKCHKIHAIFSPTCAVKVELYTAASGQYLLQVVDLGSDDIVFYDVVWHATEFLMSCGISLWGAV